MSGFMFLDYSFVVLSEIKHNATSMVIVVVVQDYFGCLGFFSLIYTSSKFFMSLNNVTGILTETALNL